jgi:predicted flap endonuclease-1-like 5' DNA nuclease
VNMKPVTKGRVKELAVQDLDVVRDLARKDAGFFKDLVKDLAKKDVAIVKDHVKADFVKRFSIVDRVRASRSSKRKRRVWLVIALTILGGLVVLATAAFLLLRGRRLSCGVEEQTDILAVSPPDSEVALEPSEGPQYPAGVASEQSERRKAVSLLDIEGVGPTYAEKLAGLGLKTTDDLLAAGASPKGREDLAAATGISGKLILRWVNMADLFRVKGVGEEYADLLEAAGVDTVPELAQRRADNLTQKMAEVNEQKQLVRRLPTGDQVAGWIEYAKSLPRVVTH